MSGFWNKLYVKLKKPRGLTLVAAYLLTATFISAALLMLLVDYEGNALSILAYTSFALAAVTLSYSVYTVVIYAPGLKGRVVRWMESHELTNRLLQSWDYRTVVTAAITFVLSIAYAVFNGALGITSKSIWYGALAAYYICLALMRGGLLLYHRKKKDFDSEAAIRAESYKRCGILLLILNAALSSAIAQMIFDDRAFEYKDWIIYAFAAYAFCKISMSVYNAIRARRQDDLTIQAIRDINLVDGAVSILALQTALLHTFASDPTVNISVFNTLTGSAVSVFSVGLSIFMITKGNKKLKEIRETKNAE